MTLGINLEGLGWNPVQPPSPTTIQYYLDKDFSLFRVPVTWEMLQPTLYGPLDVKQTATIDTIINQVTTKPGARVIFDLHTYMRRGNAIIGQSAKAQGGHLVDAWTKIARRYAGNSNVWYGLSNEPHDVDDLTLAATLNACIIAVREISANGYIVVPGNDWSNGERWLASGNDKLVDAIVAAPGLMFEVHQYLDAWGAGLNPLAQPGSGHRLDAVTAWATMTGCKLLLGETACGSDPASMAEMKTLLDTVRGCPNWVGACWFSSLGGHSDPNRRWYNLDPLNGQDMSQMALLRPD